jgi:hypothetical protein
MGGLPFCLSDLGVLAEEPEPMAGVSGLLGCFLAMALAIWSTGSRPQAFIAKLATAQTRRTLSGS